MSEAYQSLSHSRWDCGKERNFTGEHFWARGYAVATVGFNLEQVTAYIRAQEAEDEQGRF